MKNRLVRELESYEGYVPEPKECAKDEIVYDMPESEFDTYEVVVRETTDYVVRIFCKNMDDALDLARDVAESVVKEKSAEKYTLTAIPSPYTENEDGTSQFIDYDYKVYYPEDDEEET